LSRLRSRNHLLEVVVFDAFDFALSAFSRALIATLLLVLLFLSADSFSLALLHIASLAKRWNFSDS
jgi:hypothetical protein